MALTRPRITQLNTDVTKFDDPIIELNAGATADVDIGIILNRGTSGDNAGIIWDQDAGAFALVTTTADGDSSGDLTTTLTDLQVNSVSTAGFAFPSTDGTVDQIIATDGNGVLSWVDDAGGLFQEDVNRNIIGGTGAGSAITTAEGNFIAGAGTGTSLTVSFDNVFIGDAAATGLTGRRNVVVGAEAGPSGANAGTENVIVGYQAKRGSTSGTLSVFIGKEAGEWSDAGQSVVIGYLAMQATNVAHATGSANVVIGPSAGRLMTATANTTVVGASAGQNISTGGYNTGIGQNCLAADTGNAPLTGVSNVAVGNDAAKNLQGGATDNTGVGRQTLGLLTTGNRNTGFGSGAGIQITTGDDNVCLGRRAGPTSGNATLSNKLYIHNAESDTPLIGGDFSAGTVTVNGDLIATGGVDALTSATTVVDVASATAPANGQVLTATGGTAATWQTPTTGTMTELLDDGSPQLANDLDPNGNNIIGVNSASPAHFSISAPGVTTGANDSGNLALNGGGCDNGTTTIFAGSATLNGGGNAQSTGSPNAGSANVKGGNATSSTGGNGGDVLMQGGIGGATGGDVTLQPGYDLTDQSTNGVVYIKGGTAGHLPVVRFREDSANGANYVGLQAPANVAANVEWTLPDDTWANANGKFLTSDGSGNFSFTDVTNRVDVTGDAMTGDLSFGDNDHIKLGAGTDLDIYSNGTNSVLKYISGGIFVESNLYTTAVFSQSAAKLYFESSQKFETTTTGVKLSGTVNMNSEDIDNVKTVSFIAEVANTTTTQTIDWTAGQKQKTTITAATAMTFTAPAGPCNLTLKVINGGLGTITWPATVKWPGGTEPAWTSSGTDICSFYFDGTDYFGMAGLAFA